MMTTQDTWHHDMTAAYEAGEAGDPCPNDFTACYSQGRQDGKREQQLCYYVPGEARIIDTAGPDGLSTCYGHNAAQVAARYPGAALTGLHEACEASERVQAALYQIGTAQRVTPEQWEYALEVLPPHRWVRRQGEESFQMSELTCGRITACYVRIGSDYYQVYAYTNTPHAQLVEWCKAA